MIKPFLGDPEDQELLDLIPFLEKLAEEDDVRSVTKKYVQFIQKNPPQPQTTIKSSTRSSSLSVSRMKNGPKDKKIKRVSFDTPSKESFDKLSEESKLHEQPEEELPNCIKDTYEDFGEDLNENSVLHTVKVFEDKSQLFHIIKTTISQKTQIGHKKFFPKFSSKETRTNSTYKFTKLESSVLSCVDYEAKLHVDSSEVVTQAPDNKETIPIFTCIRPFNFTLNTRSRTMGPRNESFST